MLYWFSDMPEHFFGRNDYNTELRMESGDKVSSLQ